VHQAAVRWATFADGKGVSTVTDEGEAPGQGPQSTVFDLYLDNNARSIFRKDRHVLRPEYVPSKLPHRDNEIDQLASILVTALKGGRPSNILIYGKTGTGKTAVIKYLHKEIERKANADFMKIHCTYINCQIVDTEYGILANIGNMFVKDWNERIPFTGWPTEKVYNHLREKMDESGGIALIVLDEIDKLIFKSGDDVLYHLTTLNEDLKNSKMSIIGISNESKFTEFLDPRVQTRLGEERMVFPPYNAQELLDILKQRAVLAFEENALDEPVVSLCAAFAAQEHGDARRALDLLRVAGELAEREKANKVTERHVWKAKDKIELDVQIELVKTLPTQSKLLLFGIILKSEENSTIQTTGEVYDIYRELCDRTNTQSVSQRRITDLISELDMLGLINARVRSFGRGGRTREIQLSVNVQDTKKALYEDDTLKELIDYSSSQQRLM
jgi:cell division control protein 6